MEALLVTLLCVQTVVVLALLFFFLRKKGFKTLIPRRPSEELSDFLADIRRHGYGCVRIDPDTVMRRGPQR